MGSQTNNGMAVVIVPCSLYGIISHTNLGNRLPICRPKCGLPRFCYILTFVTILTFVVTLTPIIDTNH